MPTHHWSEQPHPAWTRGLHHDGSALYVSNPLPALQETVTLRLRAPREAPISEAFVRWTPDGEQTFIAMHEERRDAHTITYACQFSMVMPRVVYRFKVISDDGAYFLNAYGVARVETPEWQDFKLLADFQAPRWVLNSVFYQIFPDRFFNGDPSLNVPLGREVIDPRYGTNRVVAPNWDDLPMPFTEAFSLDFYNGDLPGIVQKMDYLRDLGITALYLNPIFISPSNHRYNISDFYSVDPHLGGNEALVALAGALHNAGMRYVLDMTPNHTGDTHVWFTEARHNAHAPTADFYTFDAWPNDYEAWLGVMSLPKLNYTSQRLREAMYAGPDAVLRHWLRAPYHADGWRLDVYNMTANRGEDQLLPEVGRGIRQAVKEERADAYLFGETFFDGTPHTQGDALDAVMNYQGFSFPVWRWLAGHDMGSWNERRYADKTPIRAEDVAEQWQAFLAASPWVISRMQFNQLGSHDTPRMLSVVKGDKDALRLAMALMFTFPGVPCLYYGDELGIEGWADPDNRRTMPWDNQDAWDLGLREDIKRMVALRRVAPALVHGGYQMLYAHNDVLAFQRHAHDQRLLIIAVRAATPDVRVPVRDGAIPDGTRFKDLLGGGAYSVSGGTLPLGTINQPSALILEDQR